MISSMRRYFGDKYLLADLCIHLYEIHLLIRYISTTVVSVIDDVA